MFLDTKHVLKVYFKPSRKKIFCILTRSNFAWPAPNSPLKVLFNFSPLHWFSKFNHFLGVCWFLGKIFANFVLPARKQFSDHHTQTFFLTEEARSHGGLWTRKVYFCVFYTQKYVYHQEIEKKILRADGIVVAWGKQVKIKENEIQFHRISSVHAD